MSALDRLLDLLPPPYSVAPDSVLAQVLKVVALQIDAAQEDLDRVRLSHWIETAFRMTDAAKLGDLFSFPPFPGEPLPLYRERLIARILAGREGAVGPREIETFAATYVQRAGRVLNSRLSDGKSRVLENPKIRRTCEDLVRRHGRVAHLFRWQAVNRGLDEAIPTLRLTGVAHGATVSPVLVNLTTGDLIGFGGRLKLGQQLVLAPSSSAAGSEASITLDGRDARTSVFSVSQYTLGTPLRPEDFASPPRLPRLARGVNEWIFLLLGRHNLPGLDSFGFGIPEAHITEGVFDESGFDQALFPAGTKARLTMHWEETEPASFILDVPRRITVEPRDAEVSGRETVENGLRQALASLHAAGVKATTRFSPFAERQTQRDQCRLLGIRLDPERAPAGRRDSVATGGRFSEPGLGGTRFE